VNFFGHAKVATWKSDNPTFIFGSMLPDFAAMCGNALRELFDQELRAGVELHIATDQLFHRSPVFVALCSRATESLGARGVKRASARAVAHVGLELMVDGELSADLDARSAYLDALQAGESDRLGENIRWRYQWSQKDWGRLLAILRSSDIPQGYRDTNFVVERLVNLLARRPNLALTTLQEITAVSDWVVETRPFVAEQSPIMVEHVKNGLGR
jgi:hypothetical protein